jgi:hypothetical protein
VVNLATTGAEQGGSSCGWSGRRGGRRKHKGRVGSAHRVRARIEHRTIRSRCVGVRVPRGDIARRRHVLLTLAKHQVKAPGNTAAHTLLCTRARPRGRRARTRGRGRGSGSSRGSTLSTGQARFRCIEPGRCCSGRRRRHLLGLCRHSSMLLHLCRGGACREPTHIGLCRRNRGHAICDTFKSGRLCTASRHSGRCSRRYGSGG